LLEDEELYIYVPKKEWTFIAKYHNQTVGHFGVERTVQKLQSNGHNWNMMRAHVRRFKKMCACCQKMDRLGPSIRSHKFTVSSMMGPVHTIAIDFIEKLLPDEYGNNTFISIICTFSRFIEFFPAKNSSAKVAAQALLQHIIGRYDMPYKITCDKGAAFISRRIKEVTDMMDVELVHTIAYSIEENAIVECSNKETKRHIRNIIFDKDVLKKYIYTISTTYHEFKRA
jgi:hypothetical protein